MNWWTRFFGAHSKASRPRRSRRPHMVESLECRDLPAASITAGVLNVVGTRANDTIDVAPATNGTDLLVRIGRQTSTFPLADITSFTVNGDRGNDRITIDARVTLPGTIQGGVGNDQIRGGGGDESIVGGTGNDRLYGGPGNDVLEGNEGNDTFDCSTGQDTIRPGPGKNKVNRCNVASLGASTQNLVIQATGTFRGSGVADGERFTVSGNVQITATLDGALNGTITATGDGTGRSRGCTGVGVGHTTNGTVTGGKVSAEFEGGGTATCDDGPFEFDFAGSASGMINLANGTMTGSWRAVSDGASASGVWNGTFPIVEVTSTIA